MKVVFCGIIFGCLAGFLIGKARAEDLGMMTHKSGSLCRNQID